MQIKNGLIVIALGLVLSIRVAHAGNTVSSSGTAGTVVVMNNEMFKQKVFDYEKNKAWKYEGNMPAIIDFYATWCGPCRMLSPVVEEIAKKYSGKIVVYKVDTDKERILSQNLGISSLPTLLFIPVKGQPQATMGALPKETLEKVIGEVLQVK